MELRALAIVDCHKESSSLFLSLIVSTVPTDHLSGGIPEAGARPSAIVGNDVGASAGERGIAGKGSMWGIGT